MSGSKNAVLRQRPERRAIKTRPIIWKNAIGLPEWRLRPFPTVRKVRKRMGPVTSAFDNVPI